MVQQLPPEVVTWMARFGLTVDFLEAQQSQEMQELAARVQGALARLEDDEVTQEVAELQARVKDWKELVREIQRNIDAGGLDAREQAAYVSTLRDLMAEIDGVRVQLEEKSAPKLVEEYDRTARTVADLLASVRVHLGTVQGWAGLERPDGTERSADELEASVEELEREEQSIADEWRGVLPGAEVPALQAVVLRQAALETSVREALATLEPLAGSIPELVRLANEVDDQARQGGPLFAHLVKKGRRELDAQAAEFERLTEEARAALGGFDTDRLRAIRVRVGELATAAHDLLIGSPEASDRVAVRAVQETAAQDLRDNMHADLSGRVGALRAKLARLQPFDTSQELDGVSGALDVQQQAVDAAFSGPNAPQQDAVPALRARHTEIAAALDAVQYDLDIFEVTLEPEDRVAVAWSELEARYHGLVVDGRNVDPFDAANANAPGRAELDELGANVRRVGNDAWSVPRKMDGVARAEKLCAKIRAALQDRPAPPGARADDFWDEVARTRTELEPVERALAARRAADPVRTVLQGYVDEVELYLARETWEGLDTAREILGRARDYALDAPNLTDDEKDRAEVARAERAAVEKALLALWPLYHAAHETDPGETAACVQRAAGVADFAALRAKADLTLAQVRPLRKELTVLARGAYKEWEKTRREYQGRVQRAQRIVDDLDAATGPERASTRAVHEDLRRAPAGGQSLEDTVRTVVDTYDEASAKASDGQYAAALALLRGLDGDLDAISAAVQAQRLTLLREIEDAPPWEDLDTRIADEDWGFNTTIDALEYKGGQVRNAQGQWVVSEELEAMGKALDYRLERMEKLVALGEDPIEVANQLFRGIPQNFWPPRAMKLIAMFRAAQAEFAEEELRKEAEKFLGKNELVDGVDELRELVEEAKKKPLRADLQKSMPAKAWEEAKKLAPEAQDALAEAGGFLALFGDPDIGANSVAHATAIEGKWNVELSADNASAAGILSVVDAGLSTVRSGYQIYAAGSKLAAENKKEDFQARAEDELRSPVQRLIHEYERNRAIAQFANNLTDTILSGISAGGLIPGLGIAGNVKDAVLAIVEAGRYFNMLSTTNWARQGSDADPESITYLGLARQAKEEKIAGGRACFDAAMKLSAAVGDALTFGAVTAPAGFIVNTVTKSLEFGGNTCFKIADWGSASAQKALMKRAAQKPPDYQAIEEVFSNTRKYARFCIAWNCLKGDPWARSWVLSRGLTDSDLDNPTTSTAILREYLNTTQEGYLGETQQDVDQTFGETVAARAAKTVGRGVAKPFQAVARKVEDRRLGRDRDLERDYFQIGKRSPGAPWAPYWRGERDKAVQAGLFVTSQLRGIEPACKELDLALSKARVALLSLRDLEATGKAIEAALQAFGRLEALLQAYSPVGNDQQPHRATTDLLRYVRTELGREEQRLRTDADAVRASARLAGADPVLGDELRQRVEALARARAAQSPDVERLEGELVQTLGSDRLAEVRAQAVEEARIELRRNVAEFEANRTHLTRRLLAKKTLRLPVGNLSPGMSTEWVDPGNWKAFLEQAARKLRIDDTTRGAFEKRFGRLRDQLVNEMFPALHAQLGGVAPGYEKKGEADLVLSVDGKYDDKGAKYDFQTAYEAELDRRMAGIQRDLAEKVQAAASDATIFLLDEQGEIVQGQDGPVANPRARAELSWNLSGGAPSPVRSADWGQAWATAKAEAKAGGWKEVKTGLKAKLAAFQREDGRIDKMLENQMPDRAWEATWRSQLSALEALVEGLPVLTAVGTTHPGMRAYREAFLADLRDLGRRRADQIQEVNLRADWDPPATFFPVDKMSKAGYVKLAQLCKKRWQYDRGKKSEPKSLAKAFAHWDRRKARWAEVVAAPASKDAETRQRFHDKAVSAANGLADALRSYKPLDMQGNAHRAMTRMKEAFLAHVPDEVRRIQDEFARLPAL